MNEKTRIQIEEMKRQTIGVEVEMNNITRENAARIAADYFGTGRYKYTADRNGYYTWSAWDTEGREWKFQRDVSIATSVFAHSFSALVKNDALLAEYAGSATAPGPFATIVGCFSFSIAKSYNAFCP